MLLDAGERPAILTRGYARRRPLDGVTVVSDGTRIRFGVEEAGDEPLMLARAVPGAIVLVGASRYLSGRLAEERLSATVHLLDDGFQHVELARDVDLLLTSEEDLTDRPLPSGRLREPLSVASRADAALVMAGYTTAAERVARMLGIATAFRVTRALGAPSTLSGDSVVVPPAARVFLAAGIARPERFFSDVASTGWQVVGTLSFPDHHHFSARDIARIASGARSSAAAIVLTTEKDAVRLSAINVGDLPIASVPLIVGIDPQEAFRDWLLSRIGHQAPGTGHPAPSTTHPAQHPAPGTGHPAREGS
jgi:tetraacyldisaccharide 4'-kinase